MPVSSVSGLLSTSLYFAAMFLLLFVLANPIVSAYDDANQRAAQQLAAGVAQQLDALAPGMESSISFQSLPGVSVSVHLDGRNVTAVVDGESATAPLNYDAGDAILSGGERYVVAMGGAEAGYGVIKIEA